ncbi:MAG: class I SAM-dependent methyltransferase, partial [Myxococcota bacterium]
RGGIGFIHTIGDVLSRPLIDEWFHKYIFPNAVLPTISRMARAMEGTFCIEDVQNFGPDYDRTLMAWHENFEAAWPELKSRYDERFYRMWRFYLLSCAAGFRTRRTHLYQIVFTRIGTELPRWCRVS